MKLCVPTSWDNALIEGLKKLENIHEVYGTVPSSVVGGGRPYLFLPKVDRDKAREHIKFVQSSGIKFNYLINAPSYAGREFDKKFRKQMFDYLDWVDSLKPDIITISNPYVVELVRKQYPDWRIKLGLFGRGCSVETTRYFEALGVERITLPITFSRVVNRLKRIRRNVKCDLELLVNQGCSWDCPLKYHHSVLSGHFAQNGSEDLYKIDYPRIKCSLKKLDPVELVKCPWIRPEDVHYYEEMGVDYFKIAGREYSTQWILRCAEAYSKRSYDGNILELLEDLYLIWVYRLPYEINNRELDGFVDYFLEGRCTDECQACNYCSGVAQKIVKAVFPPEEIKEYRKKLEAALSKSLDREITEFPDLCAEQSRSLKENLGNEQEKG